MHHHDCQKAKVEIIEVAHRLLELAAPARHSQDFCSVVWFDTPYAFSPAQAAVVKVLWEHWQNGTPDVRHETLLAEARSEARRLSFLFRSNPAWGKMIVRSPLVKGAYRLAKPEEDQKSAKPTPNKPTE